MSARARTLISFVIPTLNRARYVSRAVRSCLHAAEATPSLDVEVIVLDSQSDDGSWEQLQRTFGRDQRVRLAQNVRGLGPTRSWLDGARLVRGDLVTFIWSDDYVSPSFLAQLTPSLLSGRHVAIA